jgi:hypothetical protein
MVALVALRDDLTSAAQTALDENPEVVRDVHRRELLEGRPDLDLEVGRIHHGGEPRVDREGQLLNELVVRVDIRRQRRVVDVVRAGVHCHGANDALFRGQNADTGPCIPSHRRARPLLFICRLLHGRVGIAQDLVQIQQRQT